MRKQLVALASALVLVAGCGTAAPHQTQHHRTAAPQPHPQYPVAAASLTPLSAVAYSGNFPQRPALTSVRMDTQSTGWAILQLLHGTAIAQTTDGGAHWRTILVTYRTAVQVDSPSLDSAFVLENDCAHGSCQTTTVLATFNDAKTWQIIFDRTRFTAASISFPSASVGFVAGAPASTASGGTAHDTLYATTDGGLTWTRRSTPCTYSGSNAQSISFLNQDQGFLLCGGPPSAGEQPKTFYATEDGGQSWTMVSTAVGGIASSSGLPLSGYVHSMFFLSVQTGFIGLDRGGVYMTRDGGASWQAVFGPPLPTASGQAFSVGFSDSEHGWLLAGDGPPLYTTSDGGLTWQLVYPPISPSTAISFLTAGLGYAAGWTYDGATVMRSLDGGATWIATGNAPVSLSALEVLGPSELIALGQAALYVSLDGGRTWQMRPFAHGWYPAALGMASTEQGWVIGYAPSSGRQLFYTQNGGSTWRSLTTPFTPSAIAPLGGSDVLATGAATVPQIFLNPDKEGRRATTLKPQTPYLWRSSDGGAHWTPMALPNWQPQEGSPLGMRVGPGGMVWLWSGTTIWLSTDGGASFQTITFHDLADLSDASFIDGQDGWVLTTSGSLYSTTDGGAVWQEVASSVSF